MHGAFLFIVVTAYFLFCLAMFPLQIAMIVMGKFMYFQLRVKDSPLSLFAIVVAHSHLTDKLL